MIIIGMPNEKNYDIILGKFTSINIFYTELITNVGNFHDLLKNIHPSLSFIFCGIKCRIFCLKNQGH